MTLVDTSVWVRHLREGDDRLRSLLHDGRVLCHPFVIGELACGRLGSRTEILGLLKALPEAPLAQHEEALALVETRSLMGAGLGWVDVHLLASALLAGARLWTADRRLSAVAQELGLRGVLEG